MGLHYSSITRNSNRCAPLLCGLLLVHCTILKCLVLVVAWAGIGMASAAVNMQNTSPWLQQSMTLADARHLAGRAGLGASPQELSALMNQSRMEAVQIIVDGLTNQPHIPMPVWVAEPAPHFWKRRFLSSSMKQAFDAERDKEIVELRRWWVSNMLQTSSPQTERLVLFWHDHFATSYAGVDRRSVVMARQNQLFRDSATGSYRALLKAIIRDPAMLLYLDNQTNRKGNPNENLAREFLELFTMGEGNFDEQTVKEAARALTGYGISDTHNLSFKLHGYKRDMQNKTLFGRTGIHDGNALIDIVLEQPETAEHLVKKFWHAFVSDDSPNPGFVNVVSNRFRESDYNLKSLYTSVLLSESFWHEKNRLALIKSPATLLIGTARSLDYPKQAWTQIPSLLAMLGMDLFSPPNVAGWSEGAAFVTPGRLLNRQLALQTLVSAPQVAASKSQSMLMNLADNENQMTSTSSMARASQQSGEAPLQVRLAGHLYRGAPQFNVSLYGSEGNVLWVSETQELTTGHDTEAFGKMRDMSQLAWQNVVYHPPVEALSKSEHVQVAFLNDAAGKIGDRNLFVESVSINGKTYSSIDAQQESKCPPKNRHYAGRLYCAGTLMIELAKQHSVARTEPYTANSASILWVRHQNEKLSAIVALENVQTPTEQFHTVSFHITSDNAEQFELRLDSFSCWPDCIEQWPECSWLDQRSQEQSVSFPLHRKFADDVDCHYKSLSTSEQALVNAIYASVPDLLKRLGTKTKRPRQTGLMLKWQERMAGFESLITSSDYVNGATPFSFNLHYAKPVTQNTTLAEPEIDTSDVDSFAQVASDAQLSLAEMLIGGAPAMHFPDLLGDQKTPANVQLEKLLTHPVYQVY